MAINNNVTCYNVRIHKIICNISVFRLKRKSIVCHINNYYRCYFLSFHFSSLYLAHNISIKCSVFTLHGCRTRMADACPCNIQMFGVPCRNVCLAYSIKKIIKYLKKKNRFSLLLRLNDIC